MDIFANFYHLVEDSAVVNIVSFNWMCQLCFVIKLWTVGIIQNQLVN